MDGPFVNQRLGSLVISFCHKGFGAELSFGFSGTWSVPAVPASQFVLGPQAARRLDELAGTGLGARRGRGLNDCSRLSTCQAAIRILRATAALAGFGFPCLRLTSR